MPPIRRRARRDTNFRHRHDALTPLNILEIERLRSSITEKLSICVDTMMFSAALAALTMSEVQNGNNENAARIIATATSNLYESIADDVYAEMMQLLALEYTLSED